MYSMDLDVQFLSLMTNNDDLPYNSGIKIMKLRHLKFGIIALLSIFLFMYPALSQSTSYTAIVNRFSGGQVGQTIRATTPNQLADSIYAVIRPSKKLLPAINISLGTVNLSQLQNTIRSKGVSALYYEFDPQSIWTGKSSWKLINVSSVKSRNKTYGLEFSKSGYRRIEEPLPFTVIGMQGTSPNLRFDNSAVTLIDETEIGFTLDTGNSGIKSPWLDQYLKSKDSRLRLRVLSDLEIQDIQICISNPPNIQEKCPTPPDYLIRLSRR
jgi:hypothetical protein